MSFSTIIMQTGEFAVSQDSENKFTISLTSFNNQELANSILDLDVLPCNSILQTRHECVISFNAVHVQPFLEYRQQFKEDPVLAYKDALKMTHDLALQMNYLIYHCNKTFLGFSPANVLVVDKCKFVYLCSEYLMNLDIEENEHATNKTTCTITYPFSSDFFFSPELFHIRAIPAQIHYKVAYFSFACLILSIFTTLPMNAEGIHTAGLEKIKHTKLHAFLKRCMVPQIQNRVLLFL